MGSLFCASKASCTLSEDGVVGSVEFQAPLAVLEGSVLGCTQALFEFQQFIMSESGNITCPSGTALFTPTTAAANISIAGSIAVLLFQATFTSGVFTIETAGAVSFSQALTVGSVDINTNLCQIYGQITGSTSGQTSGITLLCDEIYVESNHINSTALTMIFFNATISGKFKL